MAQMTRRGFLLASGATFLGSSLTFKTLAATMDLSGVFEYTGWESFHRAQWSWDKKTRGAHLVNCTGACPHFVYSKDGVVMREEQSKDIAPMPNIPEYNPRGCNKGECGHDYMYGPHRIKYPLIRVGERGEGKWRRATWDEALDMIADKCVDTIKNHAPDCISVFSPVPAVSPVSFSAGHRFAHYIGAHAHTFYDWYSDHPTGQTQTCGVQGETAETADWFNSRYIILWGSNPTQTRIPDAHFLSEAQLNGTKIVSIAPDFNSSAIKVDKWIHPQPGTDGALALAMAHVIIKEKLYDAHNLKEQTDLSYLVRSDTKRFLREADVVAGGSKDKFYFWNAKTGKPVIPKGCWGDQPEQKAPPVAFMGRNTNTFPKGYIDLGDLDPAMTGLSKAFPALDELNRHSFDDPRVSVANGDAFVWLDSTNVEPFDIAIVDFPDPNNFALGKLYSTRFYRLLQEKLTPVRLVTRQRDRTEVEKEAKLLLNSREGQGTTATIALPMVRALGTLGENIEDYTGGFQRVLLELADALPDEAFLAKHLDE